MISAGEFTFAEPRCFGLMGGSTESWQQMVLALLKAGFVVNVLLPGGLWQHKPYQRRKRASK